MRGSRARTAAAVAGNSTHGGGSGAHEALLDDRARADAKHGDDLPSGAPLRDVVAGEPTRRGAEGGGDGDSVILHGGHRGGDATAKPTHEAELPPGCCHGVGEFFLFILVLEPLMAVLLTLAFSAPLAAVEGWKFEDAFLYLTGDLLQLPLAPDVNGTDLSPQSTLGRAIDFFVSLLALTFFGIMVAFIGELNFTHWLVHALSCHGHHSERDHKHQQPPQQPKHRGGDPDPVRAVGHRQAGCCRSLCGMFSVMLLYTVVALPVFVAFLACPFGAVLAAMERWSFLDGWLFFASIMAQVPTLVPAQCAVHEVAANGSAVSEYTNCMPHTLLGKIVTFVLANYAFSMAIALTMAVITGLPFAETLAGFVRSRRRWRC